MSVTQSVRLSCTTSPQVDLVMAIKMQQLIIIQAIHGPHTTYVCYDRSIILPISKNDQY